MSENSPATEPGTVVFARRVIEYWALAGGLLLIGVVLVTAWSLVRDILWHTPVSGENELVQIGVAVSVFAFLPYCQMSGSNVCADIFTARAGPRAIAILVLFSALVALIFAGILLWRSWAGMLDYRELLEQTPIMQFPLWMAYVPIIVSLALLIVACLISILESVEDYRMRRMPAPTLH